ncbi:MAG: shikimate dehydrogenase [Dehalococcoidia bacterium]
MSEQPAKAPLRLIGVIGYPLQHSVSPAMHQAALDQMGLRMAYQRWETPSHQLEWRVAALRNPELLGANVTVPYKERVMAMLDDVDSVARRTGAVNTIVNQGKRLRGYNTDVSGFLRALTEDGAMDPSGKRALVLGAGGAARAVAVALLDARIARLAISNRTPARAEALRDALAPDATKAGAELALLSWGTVASDIDLIVNATSVGMKHSPAEGQSPLAGASIPSGVLVCDLVYNPAETPLLRAARAAGARTLGGLPMLVYQGADALELWVGRRPPVDVMLRAAREALADSPGPR